MIVSDIDMTGDWFCAEPEASKSGSRSYAKDVRWFRVRDNAVEIRRGWCGEPDIQGVQHIRLELGQFAAIAAHVNTLNKDAQIEQLKEAFKVDLEEFARSKGNG